MKNILAASLLLLSLAPTKAYSRDTSFSYIDNQKMMAYCTSSEIGLEAMVSINNLVKAKQTPNEVKAFIGSQGKKYGVDTVALSTVDNNSQTFYLNNSVTSYAISIKCTWSSNIQYN